MEIVERLHEVLDAAAPAAELGDKNGVDLTRPGQRHHLRTLLTNSSKSPRCDSSSPSSVGSNNWCKIFTAFIATRQKQADIRVAMYLRSNLRISSEDSISDVATALSDRETWAKPGQCIVRDLTAGARRSPPSGLIAKRPRLA